MSDFIVSVFLCSHTSNKTVQQLIDVSFTNAALLIFYTSASASAAAAAAAA